MPTDKETIKQAIKEAKAEERKARQLRSGTKETISMTLGTSAAIGFITGFIPQLMLSALGPALGLFTLISMSLMTWALTRQGQKLPTAILLTTITAASSFLLMFGFMWYMIQYLPNSGAKLFDFK